MTSWITRTGSLRHIPEYPALPPGGQRSYCGRRVYNARDVAGVNRVRPVDEVRRRRREAIAAGWPICSRCSALANIFDDETYRRSVQDVTS